MEKAYVQEKLTVDLLTTCMRLCTALAHWGWSPSFCFTGKSLSPGNDRDFRGSRPSSLSVPRRQTRRSMGSTLLCQARSATVLTVDWDGELGRNKKEFAGAGCEEEVAKKQKRSRKWRLLWRPLQLSAYTTPILFGALYPRPQRSVSLIHLNHLAPVQTASTIRFMVEKIYIILGSGSLPDSAVWLSRLHSVHELMLSRKWGTTTGWGEWIDVLAGDSRTPTFQL